ncbi:MAG: GNAT family N-acetyltransferase [Defluviitaleaceae bacterium]|nr:GNAT family N-acetyltransferase [Defluviitaleaceae bacterium]
MRIETERLVLREFTPEDFDVLHQLMSDPVVMENVEEAYTEEHTREHLEDYCIEKKNALAVVDKKTDVFIGCMQLTKGENLEVRQIGWVFGKDFWGKGFAYEAASKLMEYGFKEMKLHKIFASTMDGVKSSNLMKKLGMTQEGVLRLHTKSPDGNEWRDRYYYGILRDEYLANI